MTNYPLQPINNMRPEITVEAAAGDRIRIAWSDDVYDYHCLARVDGDRIIEIAASGIRNYPTIYGKAKKSHPGRRTGLIYLNAASPDYAQLLYHLQGTIGQNNLATKAVAKAREERLGREADAMIAKAAFMRQQLKDLGVINTEALNDARLAAGYDRIQNGTV